MQQKIKPSELKPGMKLIYGIVYQNKKLFEAGVVLKEDMIRKIKQLSDENHTITVETDTPKSQTGHNPTDLMILNEDGKINNKATFTNIVLDIRNRIKKKK